MPAGWEPDVTVARLVTKVFERLGLRGVPTLLRYLSGTPLRNRVAVETLPSGTKIAFPAFDPYWARHLYAGVPYEPDIEQIFRRFGPARLLIDCGANIGYWSARHREFGFIGAIAIEANEQHMHLLRRNHRGPVHHAAVHCRSGEILYLVGGGASAALGDQGAPVKSIALSDLEVSGPVLVKLDIEGAEIPAIEGAKGLDAMFVYEDWPRSGFPVTEFLLKKGYEVSGFDTTPIRSLDDAKDFNRRTNSWYGPSNFVALKP